jgi:glycosyltransferase involved in cell wall biosynthesis
MHVCHVWERFWPIEIGGLERYIMGLSSYLAKRENIDFSLLTGRTKITHLTKNIKKFEDAGYIKVYRLGPRPVDFLNGFFMYAFKSQPRFIENMKLSSLCQEASRWENTKSADLYHIHGIWSDLEYIKLAIYLSKRYSKPIVATLHGGFVGDANIGGMPLEKQAVKDILFNHTAAITTYSKEVLSVLERMGLGEKSRLITNFVDTAHFANPNINKDANGGTVIFVGRLEPVTNPDLTIYAFKHVAKEIPNAKLQIIGYGSLYEKLKQLIRDLNLEKNVFLMGKQTDVRKFLWKSNIFLATNFGYIASLEAWSAELAVIAPEFGILKETISDGYNGLLVPPQNAERLGSAIISLLKDKPLRDTLAQNGARTVKNYDIRSVAPKMARIYQSALNN